MDTDRALALMLQREYDRENAALLAERNCNEGDGSEHRVVDESLELIDPTPDIHALFIEFDRIYFWSKLEHVAVRWSPRMTLCAGLCCYEGVGGLCSIRLSKPLLSLRPRKDLVQTLLHEMIHAFLFVTQNDRDHDAHGPEFRKHMDRINKLSGANITVYHSFHDEVNNYRNHWWQCNGPCKDRRPFYGLVKRAMNRAPGPNDTWWAQHAGTCNGTFIKIKGVQTGDGTKEKRKKATSTTGTAAVPFSGTGHVLDESETQSSKKPRRTIDSYFDRKGNGTTMEAARSHDHDVITIGAGPSSVLDVQLVACPACGSEVAADAINGHLDNCLHLAPF